MLELAAAVAAAVAFAWLHAGALPADRLGPLGRVPRRGRRALAGVSALVAFALGGASGGVATGALVVSFALCASGAGVIVLATLSRRGLSTLALLGPVVVAALALGGLNHG